MLRRLARSGEHARVLISGAADYALFAQVLAAYRAERQDLDCQIVDICATPLALCRWYAELRAATVHTEASDLLHYESTQSFDLIVTHAFLGYFDAPARAQLTQRWRPLLRPGGHVLTIQRIRPDFPDEMVRFTPAQAEAFIDNVMQRAEGMPLGFEIDRPFLAAATRQYTDRFQMHPIRSIDEFANLFVDGGFSIDEQRPVETETQLPRGLSGPSVAESAAFVRLVATRK